jgi:hypothetical protein
VDRAAEARALLEGSPDAAATRLQQLEARRSELLAERRQVMQNIRNENKRRRRLMLKARGLSVDELLSVVVARSAQAAAKAKAKSTARAA